MSSHDPSHASPQVVAAPAPPPPPGELRSDLHPLVRRLAARARRLRRDRHRLGPAADRAALLKLLLAAAPPRAH